MKTITRLRLIEFLQQVDVLPKRHRYGFDQAVGDLTLHTVGSVKSFVTARRTSLKAETQQLLGHG
jgi:hypothetical protein